MKKIIASLLCAVMLIGAFAVTSFARDTEINFSVSTVEGTPGDTVEVEVYLDKNPGTWSAYFNTCFNSRYFTLLSVENGEVFSDGEFGKSLLTNNGFYTYYAESANYDKNNTNTGVILTLTFEITKACPNGAHDITLEFPDDGEGWFFDATEFPDFETVFDVSCTKAGSIIVTGSDATESPETDKGGDIIEPSETKPAPGIPVTEAVTNESGETVKNDDGSVMTEEVKDSDGNIIYYETDDKGEVVTDEEGGSVTFVDTTATPGGTTGADGNGNDGGEPEKNELSPYKIILIAAIAAVVIGAVIVIIVVAKPKKEEKENNENNENN